MVWEVWPGRRRDPCQWIWLAKTKTKFWEWETWDLALEKQDSPCQQSSGGSWWKAKGTQTHCPECSTRRWWQRKQEKEVRNQEKRKWEAPTGAGATGERRGTGQADTGTRRSGTDLDTWWSQGRARMLCVVCDRHATEWERQAKGNIGRCPWNLFFITKAGLIIIISAK